MRHLWFGGSFNPVHFGHLICARAVAEQAGFDRVVLVPNRQSPHKLENIAIVDAEIRLKMCQLAVAGDPLFTVDDLELRRPGPSYTIDTVRQLRPDSFKEINWLIGADMALSLPTWHEPDSLLAETHFVLMARPGWTLDWSTMPTQLQYLQSRVVQSPQLEISSTLIRERIANHGSIRYLTPDAVVNHIEANRLYRPRHAEPGEYVL